ncbi:MAG: PCYCGC domain-containing protein [Nanoarchaeota archaeon]|nr:PCYCGC domain-containing protein [Nanoarchaeota archaeon]
MKYKINLKTIGVVVIIGLIVFGLYAMLNPRGNEFGLPDEIYNHPNENVREAYIFAVENPDVLEQVPCYCGCLNIGHESNKQCYFNEDGSISDHGTLCGGCLGTTLDVKRMYNEGRSMEEIIEYVDVKYAPPVESG